MDQVNAQTEKIATYETARTRRSIVDGNMHSDDSNNDEEFASSGFYVREKASDKKPDSSDGADNDVKENGISPVENAPLPAVNGENSKDSTDSKAEAEEKVEENEADSENKEVIEPEPEEDPNEEEAESSKATTKQKREENNVTSSSNNEEDDNVCSSSNNDEENNVSSTSNNVDEAEALEQSQKETNKDKVAPDTKEDDNIEEDKPNEDKKEEKKDDKDAIEVESCEESENGEPKAKSKVAKPKKAGKKDVEPKETEKIDEGNVESKEVEKKDEGDSTKEKSKDQVGDDKSGPDSTKSSILKDQLEKNEDEENMDQELEMDEDFDPSLLCPDISMDVDEASVMTTSENVPDDGSTSPLPYEPIFSTLVDEITGAEVQIDLTPAEMELRLQMYGPNNPVQETKVHCTACNVHLGSALIGANNRFVHPLLKVLICKNCYHFYTSGEFEKDEDGSELYCRWCGQGGQVLCCSSCEFVFCKRCIRNNFGPKKFKEIRDSDDWNCFRCEPEQLSNLRASCAEFMEYYRTELARAHALSATRPELMTIDHTKCCSTPPEKKEEPKTPAGQKGGRRKRKDEEDPDYRPLANGDEPPAKRLAGAAGGPGYSVISPANPRPIAPRPGAGLPTVRPVGAQGIRPVGAQGIRPVGGQGIRPVGGQGIRPLGGQAVRPQAPNTGQVFKVGNTTFRTRAPGAPGYTVQRPGLNQAQKANSGFTPVPPKTTPGPRNSSPGYMTIPPSGATKITSPGYIKLLPPRPPPSTGTFTVVSGTNNGKPTFSTIRPAKSGNQMPPMKHEWFEKTVRAAARVNSNLSYTLTQLNRQQSQANSVEALAMVHNKLQQVLSTSINSLIQIRKNLRTEFIAGIKNIKFPAKPAPIPITSGPIVVKDDDDVIFVSPTTKATTTTQPPPLVLSPSVTLTKKTQKPSDPFINPRPSTSGVKMSKTVKPAETTTTASTGPVKGGGFLKVRSFTALQSVTSECITIPDDPPVRLVADVDPLHLMEVDPLATDEDDSQPESPKPDPPKSESPKPDPLKPDSPKPESLKPESPKPESPKPESPKPESSKPESPKPASPEQPESSPVDDDDKPADDTPAADKTEEAVTSSTSTAAAVVATTNSDSVDESMVYDVKEVPTPVVQKMLDAFVSLNKSEDIDALLKTQRGLIMVNGGVSDSDKMDEDSDAPQVEPSETTGDAVAV